MGGGVTVKQLKGKWNKLISNTKNNKMGFIFKHNISAIILRTNPMISFFLLPKTTFLGQELYTGTEIERLRQYQFKLQPS